MTTRLACVLLLCAMLCGCGTATDTPTHRSGGASPVHGPETGLGAAVRSTNHLAFELFPRLGRGGNVVFSPYSIQAALAMVGQGARGETKAQIDSVLGAGNPAGLASGDRALRSVLAATTNSGRPGSPSLGIANRIWLRSGSSLKAGFSSSVRDDFGAAPGSVDFQRDPRGAAATINAWVSDRTAGVIKQLMAPGAINSFTSLVLANAIYLKARWQSPFDRSMTRSRPFVTAAGRAVEAQFMTQAPTLLRYAAGPGYRAVDLPYRDATLSMLLVMPTPGTFERFAPGKVSSIIGALNARLVDLAMPRLHLAAHIELNGVLSAVGMPIAFTPAADFSGITASSGPRLQIQAVEHGADLRVDEAGTVAAAATGISVVPTLAPAGHVIRLVLDHPFLALLRDDRTGSILFAAQVTDPTQA